MSPTLVFVHTVSPLIEVFNQLAEEMLPGVQRYHILDEPLLAQVRHRGSLEPQDVARLGQHVAGAAAVGADAVLVTCSTVSPAVDEVRSQAAAPVVKIDEAMIAEAVRLGKRIGVVATNPATLAPTEGLLQAQAARAGKAVEVQSRLAEGAFSALLQGDGERHDRLVKEIVLDLAPQVDVVILAQASMARVLQNIPEAEQPVPVLSSPHLALEQVRRLLAAPGTEAGSRHG